MSQFQAVNYDTVTGVQGDIVKGSGQPYGVVRALADSSSVSIEGVWTTPAHRGGVGIVDTELAEVNCESSVSVGDKLYLSSTNAGKATKTAPTYAYGLGSVLSFRVVDGVHKAVVAYIGSGFGGGSGGDSGVDQVARDAANAAQNTANAAVPKTTTVNSKALSGNISLTASDVGADAAGAAAAISLVGLGGVPTSRTVAGKALSGNITLATGDLTITPDKNLVTDAQLAALTDASAPTILRSIAGTTDTFVLDDMNNIVKSTDNANTTGTIPPHTDVAFPAQAPIELYAGGTGTFTIASGVGVTLKSANATIASLVIPAGQSALIIQTDTIDVWDIVAVTKASLGLANFKTINGNSILGTGDITVSAASPDQYLQYSTLDGGAPDTIYDDAMTIDGGTP